jgi:hypothetical protein
MPSGRMATPDDSLTNGDKKSRGDASYKTRVPPKFFHDDFLEKYNLFLENPIHSWKQIAHRPVKNRHQHCPSLLQQKPPLPAKTSMNQKHASFLYNINLLEPRAGNHEISSCYQTWVLGIESIYVKNRAWNEQKSKSGDGITVAMIGQCSCHGRPARLTILSRKFDQRAPALLCQVESCTYTSLLSNEIMRFFDERIRGDRHFKFQFDCISK